MSNATGAAFGRPPLLPHHRRMLEASAISAEEIAARGYFSVTTARELRMAFGSTSYADHLPALMLPLHTVTGEAGYNVARFDIAPIRNGHPAKYLLPYQAASRIDVPARVRPVLGDPSVDLYATEGSKKVDALVSAGVNAIGFTGVWSWRGTNQAGGKVLLADFEYVAWNGRRIHLIFDSDCMTKESVRLALERLREVMRQRKAEVILYYLEGNPDGSKVGADDYLANGGTIAELVSKYATRELRPAPGTPAEEKPKPRAKVTKAPELAAEADILGELVMDMRRLGHVGEQRTMKLIYLATTSRLLSRIVSIAVKGPSAAGKSATVERVLAFFPDDAVMSLTGMSEHFLAYDERPIAHKMLVLYEAAGMSGENATYLIRTLLSEGVIRHGTVESDKDGLHAREVVREGPAGLITTTTEVSLHPENETRLLSITADDTGTQTKMIMLAVAEHDGPPRPDFQRWHTLQHWLEDGPRTVTVPFATTIAKLVPPIAVRLRRDFGVLLTLVRAHALLHRATREVAEGKVVATLEDYGAVRELVVEIISEGLGRAVTPATRETVAAVDRLVAPKKAAKVIGAHVTYAELAHALNLDKAAVRRRARVAIAGGYLRNEEDRRGKLARIVVGDPLPDDIVVLPTVERVAGLCGCDLRSEPPHPQGGVRDDASENGWHDATEEELLEAWRQGRLDPHGPEVGG